MDNPYVILAGIALGMAVIAYAAVFYWVRTHKPAARVDTPTIDRLNTQALSQMTDITPEQAEDHQQRINSEPAPADLLSAIPPEQKDKGRQTPKPEQE